jgi:hypothetical protein
MGHLFCLRRFLTHFRGKVYHDHSGGIFFNEKLKRAYIETILLTEVKDEYELV